MLLYISSVLFAEPFCIIKTDISLHTVSFAKTEITYNRRLMKSTGKIDLLESGAYQHGIYVYSH